MGAIAWAWLAAWASVVVWALFKPRPRVADGGAALRVHLVRPCADAPPYLEAALRSAALVRTRHALTITHAIASMDDPAAPIATAVARDLEAARVALTNAPGPNRKAGQIARALRDVEADVVVVADACVELTPDAVDALVAPIAARTDGAATWAPPVEIAAPRTPGDRASQSLLGGSLHAFALVGAIDPRGLVGKLFAVRASSLAAIGGFDALRAYLGEDMELARRLRARGEVVAVAPVRARSLACGRGAREVLERYARWIAVIREQRATLLCSYPTLFFPAPLLAIVAAILGAPALLAAVVAVRAVLAIGARLRSGLRPAPLDLVLGDALLLAAFVRSMVRRRVTWSGATLRFARGRLVDGDER